MPKMASESQARGREFFQKSEKLSKIFFSKNLLTRVTYNYLKCISVNFQKDWRHNAFFKMDLPKG